MFVVSVAWIAIDWLLDALIPASWLIAAPASIDARVVMFQTFTITAPAMPTSSVLTPPATATDVAVGSLLAGIRGRSTCVGDIAMAAEIVIAPAASADPAT